MAAKRNNPRYTLYLYSVLQIAIDCEDCGHKIGQITPNYTGGEIVDVIDHHETEHHSEDREVNRNA